MNKFCGNCGALIYKEMNYCRFCGEKINPKVFENMKFDIGRKTSQNESIKQG